MWFHCTKKTKGKMRLSRRNSLVGTASPLVNLLLFHKTKSAYVLLFWWLCSQWWILSLVFSISGCRKVCYCLKCCINSCHSISNPRHCRATSWICKFVVPMVPITHTNFWPHTPHGLWFMTTNIWIVHEKLLHLELQNDCSSPLF